ncbi:DUF2573 family protein [Jeotgalibacillus soli]|uniref:DUF2573 domain-containing protein n=1 Tax=Jeotgalibacillus soli TaxID=889306 RepID=A0A0C2QX60_9BACL|nr:DUF2573 family protein [Jeotgalibacillus soli]KIL42670.1 hypothetical protein KP78_38930 [Jeotgalibacillus soli]
MSEQLDQQLQAMIEKYSELLIDETSEEWQNKVTQWIVYNHIAKSMPSLAKHWNSLYPESKEEIKEIVLSIQKKNTEMKASQQNKD